MKKVFVALLAVCCFFSGTVFFARPAKAAANVLPTASDNLSVGLRSKSELVATSDGYMRVFYDGSKVCIEYYDDSFNIKSKKSVGMELSIWGGFYAGSDAYYLVEGQNNMAENDSTEVIRVIKYDTGWNKKGTAKITGNPSLFGGEVRYPFDYGCVEMTEYNGTLYIVTGHEGYVDPEYNQGHQGFLMIAVNEASMTGEIVKSDLWHSFAQYIEYKASNLYVLEQSEGSRYTKLSKYNAADLTSTSIPVLEYGGDRTSARAIACFASVDGMALSSGNVLCLGTSIDQSKYDSVTSDTAHNIYLTVTPTSNFTETATTVKWLTDYSGGGKSFLGTKITKINDNRFMISWEEYNTSQTALANDALSDSILHYVFVDGNGNKIGKEYTAAAPISDCHPIVKGSKIVYCASNANMVNFYTIDSSTGQLSKKAYRVAGENATWELNGDVLTISGTGAISVDPEAHTRYPVSTTSSWIISSSSDNAWKTVREYVKKIVIGKGITDIPEQAFAHFDNVTEVDIADGVKSIGKEAFYSCDALRKITIPSSVTSIGEDILWTGSYWVSDNSHVVYATIYAPYGSEAVKYAQKNNISCVAKPTEVTGLSASPSTNSVKLTWNNNPSADSYQVDVYKDGKWTYLTKTTGTSYNVTGLSASTNYKFRVFAFNNDEYSSAVNVETTTTAAASTKPSAVTGLSATPSTNSVKLTWNKNSTADSYQVDVYKNGKWTYLTKTTGTSYTATGLSASTSYKFRIFAFKGSQYSSSVSVSATTKAAASTKPSAVTGLSAAPSTNSVKLAWNKNSTADSYQVDVYKNGKWAYLTKTTGTSYTATGLTAGTSYKFRVFAFKGSQYSSSVSVSTTTKAAASTKPTAVTGLSAAPSTNSVKLTWNKNSTADSYQVDVYKNGKWTYLTKTTGTSYTATGLTAGTSYKFRVFAFKGSQYSSSASVSAATKSAASTKPAAVTGLSAAPSTNSVKLTWNKNSTADSYQVDVYKNGKWTYLTKTSGTSYTATGLTAGTDYRFRIFAFKGSQYSSSASVNTSTKPTAVTGLTASPSSTNVRLSWRTSSGADSYQIDMYKNGRWVYVGKTTGTSYNVTGLSSGYIYNFRVFAFKGSSYSSSTSIRVTTA